MIVTFLTYADTREKPRSFRSKGKRRRKKVLPLLHAETEKRGGRTPSVFLFKEKEDQRREGFSAPTCLHLPEEGERNEFSSLFCRREGGLRRGRISFPRHPGLSGKKEGTA